MQQPSEQNDDANLRPHVSRRTADRLEEPFRSSCSISHDSNQDVNTQSAAGTRGEGRRGSHGQSTPHRKQSKSNRRRSSVAADDGGDRRSRVASQDASGTPRHRALISCCKGETHTHREEFRQLARRLHAGGWAPEKFNPRMQSLTAGPISSAALAGAALVIFGMPTIVFTPAELAALRKFVAKGGSMLVCSGESGNSGTLDMQQSTSNLSELLSPYGIAVQGDALISLVQQERLRPREVLVHKGALCAATSTALSKTLAPDDAPSGLTPQGSGIVFPNSCSLVLVDPTASPAHGTATQTAHSTTALVQLQRSLSNLALSPRNDSDPSVVPLPSQQASSSHTRCCLRPMSISDNSGQDLISGQAESLVISGPMCNPPLRTLAAGWRGCSPVAGRVAVLGSADALSGKWLKRRPNTAACDALLSWLQPEGKEDLGLFPMDAVPLAAKPKTALQRASDPRVCLQVDAALPGDWTTLFQDELLVI